MILFVSLFLSYILPCFTIFFSPVPQRDPSALGIILAISAGVLSIVLIRLAVCPVSAYYWLLVWSTSGGDAYSVLSH